MNIGKALWYAAPLVLAIAATPAQAKLRIYWNSPLTLAERINPGGDSFTQELAKGYRAFAMSEGYKMYDWSDANHFAEKALYSNEGTVQIPERPEDWQLEPQHLTTLQAARADLVDVLDQGARDKFPQLAATAQVKYDCWVEQQEENHQPDDIAACKHDFEDALAKLKVAMQPPPPQAAAPTPKPKVMAGQEIAREVVYFDWDRADIKPEAQAKLDKFVVKMRPMENIILDVVGHADRSGSASYNMDLSRRRAENVRTELVRQGMPVVEKVTVVGKGESDPAVPTADGVREPANRRVEVIARGKVEKTVEGSASGASSTQPTK